MDEYNSLEESAHDAWLKWTENHDDLRSCARMMVDWATNQFLNNAKQQPKQEPEAALVARVLRLERDNELLWQFIRDIARAAESELVTGEDVAGAACAAQWDRKKLSEKQHSE